MLFHPRLSLPAARLARLRLVVLVPAVLLVLPRGCLLVLPLPCRSALLPSLRLLLFLCLPLLFLLLVAGFSAVLVDCLLGLRSWGRRRSSWAGLGVVM